jgi:hypothetical protein
MTFSLFLVQGGQEGQEGPREGPGSAFRKHKVAFFREVSICFADGYGMLLVASDSAKDEARVSLCPNRHRSAKWRWR